MTHFKRVNNERLVAFIQAVAAGKPQYQAYLDHYTKKKIKKETALNNSSQLLARSEVKQMLDEAIQKRQIAIQSEIDAKNAIVAKEFVEQVLTVDQMDSFHSAVIKGTVEVEEVHALYHIEEVVNSKGKVIHRTKKPTFLRVRRSPNIREKQISVDALYKRGGHYAPVKGMFAFKNSPEEEGESVERYIVLASGERIPLP